MVLAPQFLAPSNLVWPDHWSVSRAWPLAASFTSSLSPLRPIEIVERQAGWFWNWNIFAGGWQVLGFIIFVVAGFAETKKFPFDFGEAELLVAVKPGK
jgi:NADH:ubiquinone oxidoreductase subunit H